jgi:hypothetical protein
MYLDNSNNSATSSQLSPPSPVAVAGSASSITGSEVTILLGFFVTLVLLIFFLFFYHCYLKQKFFKKSLQTHPYTCKPKKGKSYGKHVKLSPGVLCTESNSSRVGLINSNRKVIKDTPEVIQKPKQLHISRSDSNNLNSITVLEAHDTTFSSAGPDGRFDPFKV